MRTLVAGVLISVLTSLGLTVVTTTPAHADNIAYTDGPDAYGTYNDIRYGTQFLPPKGVYGQVTWSHALSLKAKRKQYGGETAGAVAGYLCSEIPVPQGRVVCVATVIKDGYFFHDALNAITQNNRKCLSYRWWAAAIWNAGRTITAIDCYQNVDYCCTSAGGGGGGGGGGGSWRQDRSDRLVGVVTGPRRLPDGGGPPHESVGAGGGGSW